MGVNVVQRDWEVFFWGGVVFHFHNGKCHFLANGEMFPIRTRKLHNISVWRTNRWKARSWDFWWYIQFQDQTCGLWENRKNVTTVLRNLRSTQQGCRRNMHIHKWPPRPTAGAGYSPLRSGPFPNYFGHTCYDYERLLVLHCYEHFSLLSENVYN